MKIAREDQAKRDWRGSSRHIPVALAAPAVVSAKRLQTLRALCEGLHKSASVGRDDGRDRHRPQHVEPEHSRMRGTRHRQSELGGPGRREGRHYSTVAGRALDD